METRRAIFAAPALLLAVPAIAQAMPPGPMMAMLAERNRIADWINAQPCWGEEREAERDAVHQKHWSMEDQILAAEPTPLDAFKAQLGLLLKLEEEGAEVTHETVVMMARGGLKLLGGAP